MSTALERRADGLLEIRVGLGEFFRAWAATGDEMHLALETPGEPNRPAIRHGEGTVLTPFPALWASYRQRQRRGLPEPTARERLCRHCGAVLELSREHEKTWAFRCHVCLAVTIQGKDRVGGTIGAGEEEAT